MTSRRNLLKMGTVGLTLPTFKLFGESSQTISAQEAGDNAPIFRGNPARTGVMPGTGPDPDLPVGLVWDRGTSGDGVLVSPMVYNGTVIVTSEDLIYAFSESDGTEIRVLNSPASNSTEPTIDDHTLYGGLSNGMVYAMALDDLDEWGETDTPVTTHWVSQFEGEIESSPLKVGDSLFVATTEGLILSLNAATGETFWELQVEGGITSSPTYANDTIMIGCINGDLLAIDSHSGHERWSATTGDSIYSTAAYEDSVVYATSIDGNLYAIDAETGREIWTYATDSPILSSPAVSDGVVYFGGDDGNLHAVGAQSGQEVWKFATQRRIRSSPTITNGIVYFGCGDTRLYAVDTATGEEVWNFKTEGEIFSTPTIANGVVYVGSYMNLMRGCYALGNLPLIDLLDTTPVRGEPSENASTVTSLEPGAIVAVTGTTHRIAPLTEYPLWVHVVFDESSGWIKLIEIDPSTLPPDLGHLVGYDLELELESGTFSLGDIVIVTEETMIKLVPAGDPSDEIRLAAVNEQAEIAGFSEEVGGETWWLLFFDDGATGFLPETVLEIAP